MAYVEKRGRYTTGMWYGECKHPKLGRLRRRFKTKDLADAYEAHVRAHGEEPQWAVEGDDTTGHPFEQVYGELKAAGGPEGLWDRGRDHMVMRNIETLCGILKLGSTPVESVTYTLAESLVANLRKRPGKRAGSRMTNATINRYLSGLSCVLKYAARKGYIDRTPELPWQDEVKHRQPTYTDTMERALVGVMRAKGWDVDAFLVEVLSVSALRAGELLSLRPEQVDEDFIVLDDPTAIKNEKPREVCIGLPMASQLRAIIASGRMPRYDTLHDRVTSALKMCGYEMPRPLHALRHTAATRTVAIEQDIQVAADLLGHKSLETTRIYRKIPRDILRQRANKVAHARGKPDDLGSVVDFPAKQNQALTGR